MNPVWAFLRLIRVQNLLIIALTQYLMRYCIVEPLARWIGSNAGVEVSLQLSDLDFFLLSLSTVMIAAAGNIINDYFDLRIDRINKPEKIIVGRYIKRRVAMGAHLVINGIGLLLGAYVSLKVGYWELMVIHIFAAVSLWYYATTFKRQLLVGNFIIALLAAVIPVIVGLYELPLLNHNYQQALAEAGAVQTNFNPIAYWLLAFGAFAFFVTLAREITKDIADMQGDDKYGCRSFPIVYGERASVILVTAIYGAIVVATFYLQASYLGDKYTRFYAIFGIALPIIATAIKSLTAKTPAAHNMAATFNKLATIAGILSSLVVYFYVTNEL